MKIFYSHFLLVYENKYCLQVNLDNCAYKYIYKKQMANFDENLFWLKSFWSVILQMLFYHRIDIAEGIYLFIYIWRNLNLSCNNTNECMICHYCIFNRKFKFQDSACNGCHDLTMVCLNISDITIIYYY